MRQPKGYTSVAQVQSYINQPLDDFTLTIATQYLVVIEDWIDRECARSWLTPVITGELYDITLDQLYLKNFPVASVQQVQWRTNVVGDVWQVLVNNTDYELMRPDLGMLQFTPGYAYASGQAGREAAVQYGLDMDDTTLTPLVQVDYTPNQPVPADITLAATEILGQWLMYRVDPDRYGTAKLVLLDAQMTLNDAQAAGAVPGMAARIIAGNKMKVFA